MQMRDRHDGTRRTRVAVVFGGRSSEHAVSCATAAGVLAAIDRERYDVVPSGISKAGQWVPVGVGQPTLLIGGLTVGGSAA